MRLGAIVQRREVLLERFKSTRDLQYLESKISSLTQKVDIIKCSFDPELLMKSLLAKRNAIDENI